MTKAKKACIVKMAAQGFLRREIAKQLSIEPREVGAVLRARQKYDNANKTRQLSRRLEETKLKMLESGYDPAVVFANFG